MEVQNIYILIKMRRIRGKYKILGKYLINVSHVLEGHIPSHIYEHSLNISTNAI